MSLPDYRRFSLNRELFPRQELYSTSGLICGHLNRVKFPFNVTAYLHARSKGANMNKALAQASRCICRQEEKRSRKETEADHHGPEGRKLVEKLEDLKIGGSRLRDE
jgi:hypothetical protein